jgi:hypothetical protein
MVGDRFGQSIDIGKDLEKEVARKQAQDQAKEVAQAPPAENPPEKQETIAPEEPQAPAAEETSASSAQAESTVNEDLIEPAGEETIEPADEETVDLTNEEPSEPAVPPLPPDPVEEDVNAIITRDFPELRTNESVWSRIVTYRAFFIALIILFVGGWFVFQWMSPSEEALRGMPRPTAPASLVAFNATMPAVGAPVIPPQSEEEQPHPRSVEELPDIFAQGLRD